MMKRIRFYWFFSWIATTTMMASDTGDVKTNKSTSEMADQGTTDQKATSQTMTDQKTTFESTTDQKTTPESTSQTMNDQKATSELMTDQKTTFESTTDQKTTPESTSESTLKSRHCAFCLKEFVGTTTW